jgi:glutaconate CoA-transferase subunit A
MSEMTDKCITIDEAAAQVRSGSILALGGMTLYRRPIAFVRALLQHFYQTGEPKDLTLLSFAAGLESDLLVGAGMVARVRTCYFGLEIFGFAPMFTYKANRGEIEIIEETEGSLALGLRAQVAGIGFMPGRPDVRKIIDPYTGEELVAFPAIKPDVAVVHAIRADYWGNAIIGKNKAVDEELILTAEKVFLTTEEVVPELHQTDIIGPLVQGIIPAPKGALPTSCHPCYPFDGEAILAYSERVSNPVSFDIYIRKWLDL